MAINQPQQCIPSSCRQALSVDGFDRQTSPAVVALIWEVDEHQRFERPDARRVDPQQVNQWRDAQEQMDER